jgi:hypothetical protein
VGNDSFCQKFKFFEKHYQTDFDYLAKFLLSLWWFLLMGTLPQGVWGAPEMLGYEIMDGIFERDKVRILSLLTF